MTHKILIVDDEADLVDMVSARLQFMGYEVEDAQNGREALGAIIQSYLKNDPYDLILLDIRMPGMTGVEVLESLRKEEELRDIQLGHGIPVIMITAMKQPFMEAFNKGCDDFVLKPFDEKNLIEKIEDKIRSKTH